MSERLGRELDVLLTRVLAAAEPGDSLVHQGGRVRHRADDPRTRRQVALDEAGRRSGRDREERLL